MKKEVPLYPNCPVEYTYEHHLNSKSSTFITKKGIVVRHVRFRKGLYRPTGYVMVQFEGNKTLSRVHESKLKPTTNEER